MHEGIQNISACVGTIFLQFLD